MPLAFTQEDCLVSYVTAKLCYAINWSANCLLPLCVVDYNCGEKQTSYFL